MRTQELLELVTDLNEELFERYGDQNMHKETHVFSLTTSGFESMIEFDDITLWDSENDEVDNPTKELIWDRLNDYFTRLKATLWAVL